MKPTKETTPDELLDTFRGRGLKSIIVFTVVVHAVVLVGTSAPFLLRNVLGEDRGELSEDERVQLAVKEATSSLRKIAEEHGLKPQDLSSQVAGGAPRKPAPAAEPPSGGPGAAPEETPGEPAEPKSAIEQEIEKVKEGPTVPPIEEEEEDLFK
ncbi:MAG: hypothetical protein HKN82_00790 [Akkermansiaceae bacterium]|nr:hypothetical protein [Akkermansiaceae bacterium]